MFKILNSKLFIHSLYINFIYFEYIELLIQKVFSADFDSEVPLLTLYNWIQEEDIKNVKLFEKPPFHTLVQILLDFAGKEDMITAKGIHFLNEDNLDFFMN